MSYHTFLELFKETIIKYLRISELCPLNVAYAEWCEAKVYYSEKIYQIMMNIIKNDAPKILLNRNPTLNYYSMLLLNIREVKKDFDDYTLSVPFAILPGLNADQLRFKLIHRRSRSGYVVTHMRNCVNAQQAV